MSGKLKGKTALVTGACSGIGLADAIEFAKEKIDTIIMVSNNHESLLKAKEIVKPYGNAEIITYCLDVTSKDGWIRLTEELSGKIDALDILVNNAGVNKRVTFQDCTLEDWNRIIAVNQTGVFLGMKYCLPLLKKSGNASIINMSSMVGLTGYFSVAYTASKWAVRGMTKSAALEFGKFGIRVNSVHPGFIDTPLNESIKDLIEVANEMTPLERVGAAAEIAKAVAFLASDDASYMSGSEVVVDGGMTSGGQFKMIADQFNIY